MKPTLRVFNELVGEGLHPIAVHSNTKIPILEDWNSKIDHEANRDLIRRPFTNVGILLGKIVDVEGDSKKANDTIAKVIRLQGHLSKLKFNSGSLCEQASC